VHGRIPSPPPAARVVFNRSVGGGSATCGRFEAAAAGTLLFQEPATGTPAVFADRNECVYYRDDD